MARWALTDLQQAVVARVTEEMFFMPPNPYWVFGVTSEIRPDAAAVRRNAYYRFFGWELPTPSARSAAFHKAEAAPEARSTGLTGTSGTGIRPCR